MSSGKANLLCDAHPLFAARDDQPTCRFVFDGFAVGDRWFAILDDLATRIEQHCADSGLELPQVHQVKEKMGLLRVYLEPSDAAVQVIQAEVELLSARVCELCGEPGSLRYGSGWLRTRCDLHVDERCT